MFKKCIKDGNPIVEALGKGLQTVFIRTYKPASVGRSFLFFPTSFYKKLNVNSTFKPEYNDFVMENIEPNKSDGLVDIKYFANVEYVIEDKNINLNDFDNYHIWNEKHVTKYIGDKNAYIWLLRVYKLKGPNLVHNAVGNVYANVEEPISLDSMKPVISDKDFAKIKKDFILTEYNKLLNDKLNKILDNQEKILRNMGDSFN